MVDLGVVVIGRNEGERLRRCLHSVVGHTPAVVYVDSGSTDASVEMARSLGVDVVGLDTLIPFTAARARNEGFHTLVDRHPEVNVVQFIDGDCEVVADWFSFAERELSCHPDAAVVCGRRRERFPAASVYNQLCDMEWDTPLGETSACGGDAMIRVAAFRQAGGFDPGVIAAEDNEFCLRVRRLGWKILRIDADMTIHDAAMYHFSQWWKRAVRCGYAYALGAAMHGRGPEHHFVRERRRGWIWGFGLPAMALAAAFPTSGYSLLLGLLYPLQVARIYHRTRRRARPGLALAYAMTCVAAKFPEFVGHCRFFADRLRGRPVRIIEYK